MNKSITIESKDPQKKHQGFQALPTCSRSISTELPALFVGCATSPGEHATDRADPWPQNMTRKNDENCQVSQFSSEKNNLKHQFHHSFIVSSWNLKHLETSAVWTAHWPLKAVEPAVLPVFEALAGYPYLSGPPREAGRTGTLAASLTLWSLTLWMHNVHIYLDTFCTTFDTKRHKTNVSKIVGEIGRLHRIPYGDPHAELREVDLVFEKALQLAASIPGAMAVDRYSWSSLLQTSWNDENHMKFIWKDHMKITSFLSKSTDQPSDSVEPLNPMEGNLLDWAMTQLQSRMPMRPRSHILPASGFPFFWRWRYGLGDGFNGFHISFQLKWNNMKNHRKFVFVETNRISWWSNKDQTAKNTRPSHAARPCCDHCIEEAAVFFAPQFVAPSVDVMSIFCLSYACDVCHVRLCQIRWPKSEVEIWWNLVQLNFWWNFDVLSSDDLRFFAVSWSCYDWIVTQFSPFHETISCAGK